MKFIPYNEDRRFDQIKRNIHLFLTKKLKSLLYIGVSKKHFQFKTYLDNLGYNITLLEAHAPNLESYIKDYICINADIIEFDTYDLRWDVVMWWHGPEHITKEKLKPTLKKIERIANKLVILGCPFGRYVQGVSNNNKYQIHKNHIYPKDLLDLGYYVDTIGRQDIPGSNLMAWREI